MNHDLQCVNLSSVIYKTFQNCGDHFISSDYYPSSHMLLRTSVLFIFDFPQHLQKVVTESRQLKRKAPHLEDETVNEGTSFWKNIKFSPSKAELQDFI